METPTLLLKKLLSETANRNAASLHLAVGSFPLLKIDGKLAPLENESIVSVEFLREIILEHLNEEERSELLLKRDITETVTFGDRIRYKMNIYYQKSVPSITLYPIPLSIRKLDELNFPREIQRLVDKGQGLIVIAGPHGSGRTSTAASIIEYINSSIQRRILTIEKPIETLFVGVKSVIEQQQIGSDAASFKSALQYALREDADVVYIGEHPEELSATLSLIADLAAGNALVLLELHAHSAINAADKLIALMDKVMGERSGRYALADALACVIFQELVPRIGGGMALGFEILLNNSMIKSMIREGKVAQAENIIPTARKEGMITLKQSLSDLADRGVIRREDSV